MANKRNERKMQRYIQPIVWSFGFLWSSSPYFTLGYIVCFMIQVVVEVAQLWVAAQVISQVSQIIINHTNPNLLYIYVASSVGLMALDKIAWVLIGHYERQIYLVGSSKIYQTFNTKLASLSVAQHYRPEVRQLIDRLEYEGYAWKPLNFSFDILQALHSLARFFTASILLLLNLPVVVLLLIIGSLPVLFIQKKSGSEGWGIWGDIGDGSRIFWGVSANLKRKESIEEIKPQRSSDFLLTRAHQAIISYTQKSAKIRAKYTKYSIIGAIVEILMAGASYAWLVSRAVVGKITFDNFVFLSSLIWQTLSSVRLVMKSVANILYNMAFMGDFIKFVNLKNDLKQVKNPIKIQGPLAEIELKNVSFCYPGSSTPSLENISLKIKQGDHISLVGLNGSGKTTLIRLLLRFYDPTEGQILVNGINLKQIDLDSYYEQIGTLFQNFNHYPLKFKDNIALADKPDEERYREVLDISGADKLLTKISESTYLSPDFENGSDLSGGEWQRVAIARNLYAGKSLFILDEPTSAIDAITEQSIFEKLNSELNKKTLITVSHRFNTVKKSKTIVVLRMGRIVETGTHSQLIKNQGLYKEMYEAQASSYAD